MDPQLTMTYAALVLSFAAMAYSTYCVWRIKKAPKLEEGVQAAVKLLNAQVDELQSAYERVQRDLSRKEHNLSQANERAQQSVDQLKLLISSLHDLPGYQTLGEE